MNVLVSTFHLMAGIFWAAGLIATLSGADAAGRLSRVWGPVLLFSGMLLAIGRSSHDPSKALVGLYGVFVLLALALFLLSITVVRRRQGDKSRESLSIVMAGLAGLSLLMVLSVHWPW